MKKALFVCNTVYQVFVVVWIKYTYFKNEKCDIIISNHMNGYKNIAQNIEKTGLFDSIYTVDSRSYVQHPNKEYKNFSDKILCYRFPEREIKRFIKLNSKYEQLFVSNYDRFSALLFDVLKRRNKKMIINIFEDGIATYSTITRDYYNEINYINNKKIKFIISCIFRKRLIQNNVDTMYLFNAEMSEWNPGCNLFEMKKINREDDEFRSIVNIIFDYEKMTDTYEEKYIFFEESFYAEFKYMKDVEIIEQIAAIVGKDKLLIKIHPRNPENRFEKLGYKTNKDTFVPWEVIAFNDKKLGSKCLISISSSSIITPNHVFNTDVKAYSILNCLEEKPAVLNNKSFNSTLLRFLSNREGVKICNDIKEIVQ